MRNRSRKQRALLHSEGGEAGREGRGLRSPSALGRLFALLLIVAAASFLSCAGAVKQAPIAELMDTCYLFDGISLQKITPVQGRISAAGGITEGNYGVLFFTKEGFYPSADVFRATERPYETEIRELIRLPYSRRGALVGVVYKAVSGGKLRPRRGIVSLYAGEVVRIDGRDRAYSVMTDAQGVYRIHLPPGEYVVSQRPGPIADVVIEPGKTTIHSIQRGAMLVD
ncbi:MAG: carboxypeptidase regulatory-like domain-containing protein [Nitrospirales bacterium]|nr:carboxypeptidase regulatory-like domain-containing protein [Nitrospirales bacterium]